jgi:hypothetical protein
MTSSELFNNHYRSNSSLKYCFGNILNTISFLATITVFKDEENWRQFQATTNCSRQHILFKTNLFWKLHRWRFRKEAIVSGRIVPENRINRIMVGGSGLYVDAVLKDLIVQKWIQNKRTQARIAELQASNICRKNYTN